LLVDVTEEEVVCLVKTLEKQNGNLLSGELKSPRGINKQTHKTNNKPLKLSA